MARTDPDPTPVPKQSDGSGRHGVSGYRGNVKTFDPRPRSMRAAPEPTAPAGEEGGTSDLASLKKDELVALATERGLDAGGTKAELLERLQAGR